MISIQTAVVYKGGHRRYFSLNAACIAEARMKVNSKCECEDGDYETPGFACHYHSDHQRLDKIIRRLALKYKIAFKERK